MIDDMKAMGFDTLRIPVAWTNGINYESGDYTIDERLMNRVDEVVNYALDADMYVILNEHWEWHFISPCGRRYPSIFPIIPTS